MWAARSQPLPARREIREPSPRASTAAMWWSDSILTVTAFRMPSAEIPAPVSLTTIDVPNSQGTIAYGINDSGTIVGIYADDNNVNHGFINKAGVITTFDVPGATSTTIRGINNAGVFTRRLFGQFREPAWVH